MTESDLRDLLRQIPDDPGVMNAFVKGTADFFGATHCALVSLPARHLALTSVSAFSGEPAVAREYERYYSEISPWKVKILGLTEGDVATDEQFCPLSKFKETEFYTGFGRPSGVVRTLGLIINKNDRDSAFLSLDRAESQRPYSVELVRALKRLRCPIQMAVRLYRTHEETQILRRGMNSLPEPIAIIDAAGTLQYANRAFEEDRTGIFSIGRGGALVPQPAEAQEFRHILHLTQTSGMSHTFTTRSGHRVTLFPQPSGSTTIRIARPISRSVSCEWIMAQLGVSPAEARLIEALHMHPSLVNAARSLGIAIGTAKTQISSVFHKTGCNSQKEVLLHIARLREI